MSRLDRRFVEDSDRLDGYSSEDLLDIYDKRYVNQGDYPYSRVGISDVFSCNAGVNFPANILEDKSSVRYLEYKDGAFILCMGIDNGERNRSLVALKIDPDTDQIYDTFTVIEKNVHVLRSIAPHCWCYSTNDANGIKYWLRFTNNSAQFQTHTLLDVTHLFTQYNLYTMMYYPEIERYVGTEVSIDHKRVTHYLFDRNLNFVSQVTTFNADTNVDSQGFWSNVYHTSQPTLEFYKYQNGKIYIKNLVGGRTTRSADFTYWYFIDYLEIDYSTITGLNSNQVVLYNVDTNGVLYTADGDSFFARMSVSEYKNGSIVTTKRTQAYALYYHISPLTYDDWWNNDFMLKFDPSFVTYQQFISSDNSLFSKKIHKGLVVQNFSTDTKYVCLHSENSSGHKYVITDFNTATGLELNPVFELQKNFAMMNTCYVVSANSIVRAYYIRTEFENDTMINEVYFDSSLPTNIINHTPNLLAKITNFSTSPLKTQIENDVNTLLANNNVTYTWMDYSLCYLYYDSPLFVVHIQVINKNTGEYKQYVIEYTPTIDPNTNEITALTYVNGHITISLQSTFYSSYDPWAVFENYSKNLILYDIDANAFYKIYTPTKYIEMGGDSICFAAFVGGIAVDYVVSFKSWRNETLYITRDTFNNYLHIGTSWYNDFLEEANTVQLYTASASATYPQSLFLFTNTRDYRGFDTIFSNSFIHARCISNTSSIFYCKEPHVIFNGIKYPSIDLQYDVSQLAPNPAFGIIGYVYLEYDINKNPTIYLQGYKEHQQESLTRIKIATIYKSGAIYTSIAEPKKSIIADKAVQLYGDTSLIAVTNSEGKLLTDSMYGSWTPSYRNVVEKSGDVILRSDTSNFIRPEGYIPSAGHIIEFYLDWIENLGTDIYLTAHNVLFTNQYMNVAIYTANVVTVRASFPSTTPNILLIKDSAAFVPYRLHAIIRMFSDRWEYTVKWLCDPAAADVSYAVTEGVSYISGYPTSPISFALWKSPSGAQSVTYNLLFRRLK